MMLMGWIQGDCPPGRRMAVADAFCVLDNLLTGHVLAADAVTAIQPEAAVTMNTSSSSMYEHDRMLTDLLSCAPPASRPLRSIATSTSAAPCTTPPSRPVTSVRRASAGSSPPSPPTAPRWSPAMDSSGHVCGGSVGGAPRGGWSTPCTRQRAPAPRCRRVRLVRPRSQPRPTHAAAAHRERHARLVLRTRAIWDVESHPDALRAWCAIESGLRPGLPLWVVENGMASQVRDGRALPRSDGMDRPRYVRQHLGAVADAVAPACRCAPTCTGRWSTITNGAPTSPVSASSAWTAVTPTPPRWLDSDAQGDDAAGEYARVLAGLRAGDRTVLERPG